ncbi:hypothetical protein [Paraburkholderia xenovorans]|uniref:hypothetical protein n=1 Tax=Paraburkholderia xenovorans TaxID=36873 RepID=UPI0015C524D4|nr:hypothetical protein [Paraburkholderia xenovorans]NPT36325.1 hypothetical protein [Paraburkholderia xenovorans]
MSVFNEAEIKAAEAVSTSQNAAQSIAKNRPVRHSRRAGVFTPLDYMHAFPGDHATYTLLSQLMYWRLPKDNGQSKLTIKDDQGNWVIAKTAAELFTETGLTRGQIDQAKAKLKKLGIINAVSGARDAVKTTFYSFTHFPGNTSLSDYPTIGELRGIACTDATQCMPTCNASHAHMHSNTESVSKTVSKTKNIQNGDALTLSPEAVPPVDLKHDQGKSNPKKCEASEPFLKICLSKKLEFLAVGLNTDNPIGSLVPELTDTDRDIAQRLEYRLTEAGIDPLAFLAWLTPIRFQRLTLDLDLSIDYAFLWMGKTDHQTYLMDAYRAYLTEQGKFNSNQQIKLCAMAPAGKKPPLLPLYEQDPDIAVGLFSWDQHWLDHQEDGKWGGRTRLEHLRKYSRFTPEMETWITSEAIRDRVLDLLGVHDAAAA